MSEELAPQSNEDGRWFDGAVVYQIYPRSYQDSNGDGIGDLDGIIERMGYIADLGVDAIWLSPFFTSPQRDHGYDVADYSDVDPIFGDLDSADRLISSAHEHGLKVIVDGVYNHSSDEHPWFVESRSSRSNPKADWYWWSDGRDGGKRPPNNWKGVVPFLSAWHRCEERNQWYLASFHRCQPDLNWNNPEVRDAMFDVVGFWLDRGVDGFRLDMFTFIMKDQSLRSEKRKVVASRSNVRLTDGSSTYNIPANYDLAHELREFCRNRRGADDVMLVGECFGSLDQVARYSVGGDGLTHAFSFDILAFRFDATWFKDRIDDFEREFPFPAEPAYVFENHDRTRLTDRVHGDLRKARLLATLLLTVRGQPTIYQGQELGMTNTYIPIKEGQDPIAQQFRWLPEVVNKRMPERINRDEVRTPMQWDSSPTAGFCSADVAPWLPVNPDHTNRNVDAQHDNPASMLTLYKELLAMRRAHRALQSGRLDFVAGAPENVVAFRRSAGVDSTEFTVLANFGESAVRMVLSGLSIELATGPGVGFDNGSLLIPGCTAVVLRNQPSPT